MKFPDARTETLNVAALQSWTTGLIARRFPAFALAITAMDLVAVYAFLAGAVLLLSGLSGEFFKLVERIVPGLNELFSSPHAIYIGSALCFAIHVAAGWMTALLQRSFSVACDRYLRQAILNNERYWIAPRPAFAVPGRVGRQVLLLASKSRSVTRSARALISILPSVIFLVTAVVSLLILAPTTFLWLAALTLVSVVLQRLANARILALEHDFASHAQAQKRWNREMVDLHDRSHLGPGEEKRRSELAEKFFALSRRYFSRSMLTDLTRYASFGSLTLLSFVFLAVLIVADPSMLETAFLEQLIVLLILARSIVGAVAGIAANQAILAKYAYHAHQTFLYFHGPVLKGRRNMPKQGIRLIGSCEPTPYGLGFYVDALNELHDTDLRQHKGGLKWHKQRNTLVAKGASGASVDYEILPISNLHGTRLDLLPGDVVVLYSKALKVTRHRSITTRVLRKMMKRDARRAAAAAKETLAEIRDEDDLLEEEE